MCGIVGISVSQPNRLPSLKRAIDCIAHRGPDGNGAYQSSHVALGHTRLAILDLSVAGAQPMVSHDGNHVLTYNGEIYNYSTLRDALIAKGVQFRGHSDSEVLLEGYVHFGADVLGWLNGIFAFAVLDVRSQQLFVARDHLGISRYIGRKGISGLPLQVRLRR
jgi:asparagine synthase (glutamine-hydrolysing)